VHIVGHDACNLVHIGLAYMQRGGHAQDLVNMIFNYPTLAEAYGIAAFNALNKLFLDGEIGDPPVEVTLQAKDAATAEAAATAASLPSKGSSVA
jgi:NAD(P) transhydrogenase